MQKPPSLIDSSVPGWIAQNLWLWLKKKYTLCIHANDMSRHVAATCPRLQRQTVALAISHVNYSTFIVTDCHLTDSYIESYKFNKEWLLRHLSALMVIDSDSGFINIRLCIRRNVYTTVRERGRIGNNISLKIPRINIPFYKHFMVHNKSINIIVGYDSGGVRSLFTLPLLNCPFVFIKKM